MTKGKTRETIMFPSLYEIAGSGLSVKLLSASTAFCDKTGICIGRAVMALLYFFI
jgi:hypothetical protein